MKKTNINIISGFLGCGKTTFIKKIIEESVSFDNTVIIENEFGEVSIDGKILELEGVKVKEINAGCICCSVSDDFEKSIKEIKKNFDPDSIIIEPSGVGKLSEIIDICRKHNDKFIINKLITILDLKKYYMYLTNFGEFYKDQIKHSNVILFSRFTEALESGVDLVGVKESIFSINHEVEILDIEWNNLDSKIILKSNYNRDKDDDVFAVFNNHEHNHSCNHHLHHGDSEHCCSHHEEHHHGGECCSHDHSGGKFESITLFPKDIYTEKQLTEILNLLDKGNFGKIIRAKGSVHSEQYSLQFDFVPGEINIHENINLGEKSIVIIGENLETQGIKSLIK